MSTKAFAICMETIQITFAQSCQKVNFPPRHSLMRSDKQLACFFFEYFGRKKPLRGGTRIPRAFLFRLCFFSLDTHKHVGAIIYEYELESSCVIGRLYTLLCRYLYTEYTQRPPEKRSVCIQNRAYNLGIVVRTASLLHR